MTRRPLHHDAKDAEMTPEEMFDEAFDSAFKDRRNLISFLEGIDPSHVHWRPPDGEWSLHENLEHILLTDAYYARFIEKRLTEAAESGSWDTAPENPREDEPRGAPAQGAGPGSGARFPHPERRRRFPRDDRQAPAQQGGGSPDDAPLPGHRHEPLHACAFPLRRPQHLRPHRLLGHARFPSSGPDDARPPGARLPGKRMRRPAPLPGLSEKSLREGKFEGYRKSFRGEGNPDH